LNLIILVLDGQFGEKLQAKDNNDNAGGLLKGKINKKKFLIILKEKDVHYDEDDDVFPNEELIG
jgi:hypothetical protein